MKKRKLFAGILACALCFSSPAVADAGYVYGDFNTVNLEIDGEHYASQGEDYTLPSGTVVPYSITYNDTTYLPIRKVSELVGQEIFWDEETRTVSIGQPGTHVPGQEEPVQPSQPQPSNRGLTFYAEFNTVNMMVDGKLVAEKDTNYTLPSGTQVPYSISYHDTTYLPIRKVSEMVSRYIGWDEKSRTINISQTPILYPDTTLPDFGNYYNVGLASTPAGIQLDQNAGTIYFYSATSHATSSLEQYPALLEEYGYSYGFSFLDELGGTVKIYTKEQGIMVGIGSLTSPENGQSYLYVQLISPLI